MIHKSFFSPCETKDQVNLQLALCWLKGSLMWNYLCVGNAHTLTYCLRSWEVLSRRQVKSCLSGEKLSAKSLDKTLGSMHWLSPSEKVNQAVHLHPFPALTKVAKPIAAITQRPSLALYPSLSIRPLWLNLQFSLFIATLNMSSDFRDTRTLTET